MNDLSKENYAEKSIRGELRKTYWLRLRMIRKAENCKELQALCRELETTLCGARTSDGYDRRLRECMEKLNALNEELLRDTELYADAVCSVNRFIDYLTDERYRAVMKERYVYYRTWEDIAENLFYTPRHVLRLHKAAVEELEVIEKNNRQSNP